MLQNLLSLLLWHLIFTLKAPSQPPTAPLARNECFGGIPAMEGSCIFYFILFFFSWKKKIGILSLGTRCHSNSASSRLQRQRGWGISLTQKAAGGAHGGACATALGLRGRLAVGQGGCRGLVPPVLAAGCAERCSHLAELTALFLVLVPTEPCPLWMQFRGARCLCGCFKSPPKLCHSATYLCPAIPKPAGFAPGLHPISHLLFNFFRTAYPAKRGTGQSLLGGSISLQRSPLDEGIFTSQD